MARLAARLEDWEPRPLRHPLVRAGAIVWASPVSAVGVLVGLAAAAPARLHDGVLLFAPLRGVPRRVMQRRGFSAATFGHVVLSVPVDPPATLMAHELVHTRQTERLGILMAPLYLGLLAIYGYRRHPLELAAYRIAARPSLSAES